jgi:hypothetical protein
VHGIYSKEVRAELIMYTLLLHRSRDSSVGIAMDYGLDGRGSIPGGGSDSSLLSVQTGSGAHPASYPMGTGDLSLGVNRPRREDDRSPPSSSEVKNAGAVPPLSHTYSWRNA